MGLDMKEFKPLRILDNTEQIQQIDSVWKQQAQILLSRFDVVFDELARKEIKHYPLDDLASDWPNWEVKIKNLSAALWLNFIYVVNEKLTINNITGLIDPVEFDERVSKDKKLGKITYCAANRFSTIGIEIPFGPLLFSIDKGEDGIEMMGEINFSVEIY